VSVATVARPRSQRIRTPLFLVGVGLALLSFVAMFAFGVVLANRSLPGTLLPAVAAARDISPREPILPSMLITVQQPASLVPPKAILHVSDLKGYSALVTIYKGQVLTANVVSMAPDQVEAAASTFLPIPQGFVAMTMPTNELQGVAGYVAPGDYINVLATVNTALFTTQNARTVTRTVFTSLHVIRVGPPSVSPKEGQVQGVASSLTVVLSECDAQFMDWLMANATLKYTLLSYKDYKPGANPTPDPDCPSTTAPTVVGPGQVDARWSFTKA